MKSQPTWRRGLSARLLTISAWLLPANRRKWADVMRNEVAHIDDDREALHWAIGSVRAGLAARLNDLPRQRIFSARSGGIVWIVIFIVSSAFNFSIALSARLDKPRQRARRDTASHPTRAIRN